MTGNLTFIDRTTKITSGLLALADGVQAYLDDANVGTKVFATFNREHARQINQGDGSANRICFMFGGLDDDEDLGELTGARQNSGTGRNPRELYTWEKRGVMSIWAVDALFLDDERKQITAIENLFEWAMRAVQDVAKADFRPGKIRVAKKPSENRYGVELLVDFVHKGPLFDITYQVAKPSPALERGPVNT